MVVWHIFLSFCPFGSSIFYLINSNIGTLNTQYFFSFTISVILYFVSISKVVWHV